MRLFRFFIITFGFIFFLSCNSKQLKIEEKGIVLTTENTVELQKHSHENINDTKDEFYINDISDEYTGTYLPEIFIKIFSETNSYADATQHKGEVKYNDVLAVNKNIIYSNNQFHDQYAMGRKVVDKYSFLNDGNYCTITDQNGVVYKKVANSADYYKEIRKYILTVFFSKISMENGDNPLVLQNDSVQFMNKIYTLNLDSYNIPLNDNLMLINSDNEKIGIQIKKDELILYNLIPDEDLRSKNDQILMRYKLLKLSNN